MKLALATEGIDPGGMGAGRWACEIAGGLAARGHQVTVLAEYAHVPESWNGTTVLCPEFLGHPRFLHTARFVRWARRELADGGYDGSLSLTSLVSARLVLPLEGLIWRAGTQRGRAVSRAAGGAVSRRWERRSLRNRVCLWLERRALAGRSVHCFVAPTDLLARQLTDGYGISGARLVRIGPAVDLPALAADERQRARERVRRGFAVPPDAAVLALVSGNPMGDGLEPLLGALRLLRGQGREVVVLLVGRLGYAVQALCEGSGLREAVRFVGQTAHLEQVYAAADVTVLPTFHDPVGRSVLESLAQGVPVVTSVHCGAAELGREADSSAPWGRVLADPADASALAAGIGELLEPGVHEACRAAAARLAPGLAMGPCLDRLEALLAEEPAKARTGPAAAAGTPGGAV